MKPLSKPIFKQVESVPLSVVATATATAASPFHCSLLINAPWTAGRAQPAAARGEQTARPTWDISSGGLSMVYAIWLYGYSKPY